MNDDAEVKVVSASRDIAAGAVEIFELVADPAQHVLWDGNDNVAGSAPGQRVRQVGDVFVTTLTKGSVRENHVVELEEGRRIAWRPAETRAAPTRTPLAVGARTGGRDAYPGHSHLRLDRAHRREPAAARPRHDPGAAARLPYETGRPR